jgi:hypothetical protein
VTKCRAGVAGGYRATGANFSRVFLASLLANRAQVYRTACAAASADCLRSHNPDASAGAAEQPSEPMALPRRPPDLPLEPFSAATPLAAFLSPPPLLIP